MLPLVALWNDDTALASTEQSPAVESGEFLGGLASGVHCVGAEQKYITPGAGTIAGVCLCFIVVFISRSGGDDVNKSFP